MNRSAWRRATGRLLFYKLAKYPNPSGQKCPFALRSEAIVFWIAGCAQPTVQRTWYWGNHNTFVSSPLDEDNTAFVVNASSAGEARESSLVRAV
jgi:hypothetical protein